INRVVHDHGRAEELSVEVFWKLSRTSAAHGPNVRAWLYTTALRMALDDLRKQTRREKYERLFSHSRTTITDEAPVESQRQVRRILGVLDRRSAELLLLRSEGFQYQEIAQMLGLSPASVGTLLRRAQQAFRKEYVKLYGQPG